MKAAHCAYISLGSNTDDAEQQLDRSLAALAALPDVLVAACSPRYRTEPQGYKEQPWFVNQVAAVQCGARWQAGTLLQAMLALESSMGRTRSADPALRFGPRCIDLDLLLFDEQHSTEQGCLLPHPRMAQRAFVLIPLRDIAPERIVADGKTAAQLLAALEYRQEGENIWQV